MKARHPRSRFLALALTAIVVAGLATASPARALVQVVTTLYSGALTVHTANGKSWHLTLGVNPNGDGSTSELGETILRSFPKGEEDHSWRDTIPQSSLTFDTNSGDGTLKTPQSVAALTILNLKFTTTGRRNVACSSGSETRYFGNLTGTAILHTQLRAGRDGRRPARVLREGQDRSDRRQQLRAAVVHATVLQERVVPGQRQQPAHDVGRRAAGRLVRLPHPRRCGEQSRGLEPSGRLLDRQLPGAGVQRQRHTRCRCGPRRPERSPVPGGSPAASCRRAPAPAR